MSLYNSNNQNQNGNNVNISQFNIGERGHTGNHSGSNQNNPYKNIGWVNGILQHYNSEIDQQSIKFTNYVK